MSRRIHGVLDMKRSADHSDIEEFGHGSVYKISAQNFMTYESIEVYPGPRLNLVLGPNGTGKSSLVCALCIGLAGSPKLLGRADSVVEFVRRGQQEGWVEIWLVTGQPQSSKTFSKIRRLIRKDGSSKWSINGVDKPMKDIKALTEQMNVQLDNLCQFLPQDKVSSFAALRPCELLEETEKAIGNALLYTQHMELKTMKDKVVHAEQVVLNLQQHVDQLQNANNQIERDVQRFRERERLVQKAELIDGKIKWLEYEEARTRHAQIEADLHACQGNVDKKRKELRTAELPIRKQQERAKQLKAKTDEARKSFARSQQHALAKDEQLSKQVDKLNEAVSELEGLQDQQMQWQLKKLTAERAVQQRQQEVNAVAPLRASWQSDVDALKQQREQVSQQMSEQAAAHQELSERLAQLSGDRQRLEDQKRRLSDVKQQRLAALGRIRPEVPAQAQWVEEHRHALRPDGSRLFKGAVMGPIALEVNVNSRQHACIVEQAIPRNRWATFVVEHAEDQRTLIKELEIATGRKPAVTQYAGNPGDPIRYPDGPADAYAAFGVSATLDQVIQAPDLIKAVLVDENGINKIYIGNGETERRLRELPQQISKVFTNSHVHTFRRSAYDQNVRTSSSEPVSTHIQILGQDTSAVAEEQAALQGQLSEVEQAARALDAQLNQMRDQWQVLNAQLEAVDVRRRKLDSEHKEATARMRAANRELTRAKDAFARAVGVEAPAARQADIKRNIESYVQAVVTAAEGVAETNQAMQATMLLELQHRLQHKEADVQAQALQGDYCSLRDEVERLEQLEASIEARLQCQEQHLRSVTTDEPDEATQQKFADLPAEAQALRDLLHETRVQADGIVTSHGVMQQYMQRQRDIDESSAKLAAEQESLSTLQLAMGALKDQWLPQLRALVGVISDSFSKSFSRIGCAGEVHLLEAGGDDYSQFAIEIKVKFRDTEELQVLNACRQSGGERSVSTILYLIAIQGVTKVPFRVVDEINQGMDAHNERKAFEQLVEASTQDDTPQCFLLTPKLLPGLEYSADVTILQIMNGPHVNDLKTDFTMADLLGNRLLQAAA